MRCSGPLAVSFGRLQADVMEEMIMERPEAERAGLRIELLEKRAEAAEIRARTGEGWRAAQERSLVRGQLRLCVPNESLGVIHVERGASFRVNAGADVESRRRGLASSVINLSARQARAQGQGGKAARAGCRAEQEQEQAR